MITPEALSALRDRLIAATGPMTSREIEKCIRLSPWYSDDTKDAQFWNEFCRALQGSVDAALGLVTRLLPGWMWVREHSDGHAYVRLLGPEYARYEFMGARNSHCTGSFNADRNVPIAILIALVSALSQPGVQS